MTQRPAAIPPEIPGFTFIRLLGSGGFSDVFLYEQKFPRRKVAVKVLLTDGLTEATREAFTAEANLMAQLSTHPYIVTIHHADVADDDRPYFVMEYCPGPSLGDRYKREQFAVADVLQIGIRLSSAVATAHLVGILHRDIKPSNVLTNDFGWPALTDFGISSAVESEVLGQTTVAALAGGATGTGTGTGTGSASVGLSIPWSPPEMFDDEPTPGVRSDVFSLAATIFTLLAGHTPFEVKGRSNSPAELMGRIIRGDITPLDRPDVSPSLVAVLNKGMSVNRADRYATAVEFARGLQRVELELSYLPTPIDVPNLMLKAPDRDTVEDETVPEATRIRAAPTVGTDTSSASGIDERTTVRASLPVVSPVTAPPVLLPPPPPAVAPPSPLIPPVAYSHEAGVGVPVVVSVEETVVHQRVQAVPAASVEPPVGPPKRKRKAMVLWFAGAAAAVAASLIIATVIIVPKLGPMSLVDADGPASNPPSSSSLPQQTTEPVSTVELPLAAPAIVSVGSGTVTIQLDLTPEAFAASDSAYTVLSEPPSSQPSCTPNALCTFTGLTNGTPYVFYVNVNTPKTPDQDSQVSAWVTPAPGPSTPTKPNPQPRTPTKPSPQPSTPAVRIPDAPSSAAIKASGNAPATLTMTWGVPASNGGAPITKYEWAMTAGSAETAQLTGLTASVNNKGVGTYAFRVRAYNSAGWGSWTASGSMTVASPPVSSTVTISRGRLASDTGMPNAYYVHVVAKGFAANSSFNAQCFFNGDDFPGGAKKFDSAGNFSGDLGCWTMVGPVTVRINGVMSNVTSW